ADHAEFRQPDMAAYRAAAVPARRRLRAALHAVSGGSAMMQAIDLDTAPIQSARVDLAAALRACGRMGLIEAVANHFSVKLPGHDDLFLVNPEGVHWSELRASDLIVVDTAGNKIAGAGKLRQVAFVLHGVLHRELPAAAAILHCHPPYGTALTM